MNISIHSLHVPLTIDNLLPKLFQFACVNDFAQHRVNFIRSNVLKLIDQTKNDADFIFYFFINFSFHVTSDWLKRRELENQFR